MESVQVGFKSRCVHCQTMHFISILHWLSTHQTWIDSTDEKHFQKGEVGSIEMFSKYRVRNGLEESNNFLKNISSQKFIESVQK